MAKPHNQPCQKSLGCFGISPRLRKNIERISIRVYSAPKPVLHAIDRDHDLIHVPLVVWTRPVPANAGRKMRTKPVDPKANSFAANHDTTLCQQILNIRRAERKAVVRSNGIGDDLARVAKTFQARQ